MWQEDGCMGTGIKERKQVSLLKSGRICMNFLEGSVLPRISHTPESSIAFITSRLYKQTLWRFLALLGYEKEIMMPIIY
jgi:hypothetical protein